MNVLTEHSTRDEAVLWSAISTFAFDGPDTNFTFAARLARENAWSTRYTERVIAEYRKFLFLCCVTQTGVTPSDPVDQAWHLHLTYTRSYWVDLCRNTLGRDLHHNPTKGGAEEGKKFNGMYSDSQTLYKQYFGETPPTDIWHGNEQRFSDIDFQRVNQRTNWIIPKPTSAKWLGMTTITGAFGAAALFLQANGAVLFWLLAGFSFLFVILIKFAANNSGPNRNKPQNGSSDDGGGVFFSDSGDGHHTHHGGDGHSDGGHGDAGGGDSGCSSSGCSGCGGGCGGGGD